MTGIEIDGKVVANEILQRVAVDVDALKQDGWTPTLVSIRIGDNSAVDRYVPVSYTHLTLPTILLV